MITYCYIIVKDDDVMVFIGVVLEMFVDVQWVILVGIAGDPTVAIFRLLCQSFC